MFASYYVIASYFYLDQGSEDGRLWFWRLLDGVSVPLNINRGNADLNSITSSMNVPRFEQSGRESLAAHARSISSVSCHPSDAIILSACVDGTVSCWRYDLS
jgi:hypothetical protein